MLRRGAFRPVLMSMATRGRNLSSELPYGRLLPNV